MSAGDSILDATGKLMLRDGGKVFLSNGTDDSCCCGGGGQPTGCFLYTLTPFDRVGPTTDPNTSATYDYDGGSYLINGGFRFNTNSAWPKGVKGSQKCVRILIWQGVTVGRDPANTYCTLTPASSSPTYTLGTIRYPQSVPYFAAGGNATSGPYLDTKPNWWQCLGIVGIASTQWSPPSFTLIEKLLRADTPESLHSPASWYLTTGPLVDGWIVDVAAICSNYKRMTAENTTPGTPNTYEAVTAGNTWINQIRVSPTNQP
jgi:hypothetical protein